VRSDKQLNPRFSGSRKWSFDRGTGGEIRNVVRNPDGSENVWTAFSHSGNERNRMFLNQRGNGFQNVSGVSGVDSVLDGRSFAMADFNRDGKSDLAVVNANGKLLQIFENRINSGNNFVSIKLKGGPASNRDAIGSRVVVEIGDKKIMRVLSCGEGFAAQNSRTIVIGLGDASHVDRAVIIWPSGKKTGIGRIDRFKVLNIEEGGRK
jgi:hypothetical protein